jgi:hypothetical protein
MATSDQIAMLRTLIDEADDADPYTDDALSSAIDVAGGDINKAAYYQWVNKAAGLSSLVDITEGGSTRRNSQAYTNAQGMVKHFAAYAPSDPSNMGGRTSRTRAIVRP